MKKVLISFIAVFMLTIQTATTWASFGKTTEKGIVSNVESEDEKNKPTGLSSLTVEQILELTPKSYKELTGEKMTFKEKVVLKYVQRNMKRDLKKEGKVDVKQYFEEGDRRFNLGGFALGLLLGLIGVALAHIFSNDKSFRRSSWYGIGVLLIIAVIISVAGGGN